MAKHTIAFVIDLYPCGGTEAVTAVLASYFSSHEYKVYLFVKRTFEDRMSEDDFKRFEIINLPDSRDFVNDENIEFVQNKINELSIDLCIMQGMPELDWTTKMHKKTSAKIIYCLHSVPLWDYISTLVRKKYLATSKGWMQKLEWYLLRMPLKTISRVHKKDSLRNLHQIYSNCDKYVLLCDGFVNQTKKALNLDENNHLCAINNPILPNAQINLEKKKQLLYVGRLHYTEKRIDRLLKVWSKLYKKHPDWELLIVGDGDEADNLKALANTLKLERVRFCGYSNPKAYYETASIQCLTSTFEGWPMVQMEAQQAGVIPIAFDCSAGVRELLAPSWKNGVLVKPYSIREYTRKLDKLMSDDDLRKQMQKNVIEKAKHYDTEVIGRQWEQLFEKLLSDKQ